MDIVIDVIGYLAAVINNISMYPQAYNITKIIRTNDVSKLENLSIATHIFQITGCSFWLIYSYYHSIYPIIIACIINILPNSYICYIIIKYKPREVTNKTNINSDFNSIDLNSIDLELNNSIVLSASSTSINYENINK